MQVGAVDLVNVFLSEAIQISDSNPQRQTAATKEIFNLPNVRDRAARSLAGGYSPDQIGSATRVEASVDSSVIRVIATSTSPLDAQRISNAMSSAFIAQRVESSRSTLTRAQSQVRQQYNNLGPKDQASVAGQTLRQRLRQVSILGALANGNVEIIQGARRPAVPVAPRPRRDAILGAVVALFLALSFTLLRARLDDRIRDTAELEEVWGLPVVGLVPQTDGLRKRGSGLPDASALEALSLARTNLRYLHVGGSVKTVVVTSAVVGEGKSTITTNLAIAASLAGSKVLIVEGDLRRPTISAKWDVRERSGLSEVLAGLVSVDEALMPISLAGADGVLETTVDFLPAGMVPPSPIALIEGPAMKETLALLRDRYDIILIDTPPAIVVADALAMIDEVDGVLVVSRLGTVTRSALGRLRDTLESVEAPVLGQLINSGGDERTYAYAPEPTRRFGFLSRAASN